MSKLVNWKTITGVGGTGVAAGIGWLMTHSIPKELASADTFLAGNLRWAGWHNPPPALATQTAQNWILLGAIGVAVIAVALLIWGLWEKPRPKIKRDVGLREVFGYIRFGKWKRDLAFDGVDLFVELSGPWRELSQAAAEGRITLWGRATPHGVFSKIDNTFWETHQPKYPSVFDVSVPVKSERSVNHASYDTYYELSANRAEIEGVWKWTTVKRMRLTWKKLTSVLKRS